MLKKAQIPSAIIDHRSRRAVTVIVGGGEPALVRIFRIVWFAIETLLRSIVTRLWPPLGKADGRFSPALSARRVRHFFEKVGGLWVKTGQLIAMRQDLFDAEFCAELSHLHDRSFGFPGKIARQIVEQDLDAPIDHFFSEFNEEPLAAASIGQAHEATLRSNGTRVVVKVRRPNVVRAFGADLRIIEVLVGVIKFLRISTHGEWDEMLYELKETFLQELDYRLEASSIERMRKLLDEHKVYVPKVFRRLCSERLLVMEYVDGVFMSEYIATAKSDPRRLKRWLKENKVKPSLVGRRLLFSHFRQLFEDNLYHCDLHPGNIVLLRNSRFALIDFGSVAFLEKSLRDKERAMFEGIGESDDHKVVDVMLLTSPGLPDIDINPLREELLQMRRSWRAKTRIRTLPYHEKSFNAMMADMTRILGKFQIPMNWAFLRLLRAEITLDASLVYLIPEVNYVKLVRRYSEQARLRMERRAKSQTARRAQMTNIISMLDMPKRFAENTAFDSEHLRRRAMNFEWRVSKAAQAAAVFFSIVARVALVGALIVALVCLQRTRQAPIESWLLRQIFDQISRYPIEELILVLYLLLDLWWTLRGVRERLKQLETAR